MKTEAKQNFQDLMLVQDSTSTLSPTGPAQTGLQSNPIHAANIRRLTESGGVSISIKEEHEVGLDPVMDEIPGDLDFDGNDECYINERTKPVELDDLTLHKQGSRY